MSASVKTSKSSEVAGDSSLIAGILKHLSGASVIVNGTPYPSADLVKAVQATIDAVNATIATRATYQAAVKAEITQIAASRAFVNALRKAIYTMFTDIAVLADFGLAPHKKAQLTPAQRIAATEKAKATRVARHTMGKKQKAAITGTASPSGGSASSPKAPEPVAPASPPTAPTGAPVVPVASPAPGSPSPVVSG